MESRLSSCPKTGLLGISASALASVRPILFTLAFSFLAQPQAAAAKNQPDPSDALFQGSAVPRLQIQIPESGMDTLRKYQWRFGPQAERDSVPVTVREGQVTYTNVALHLKGAAGSFRSVEENPAMTLTFDKTVKKQRFHGLSKLSLNNSVQDPTFISEQLCRELFLKAGVPTPRATHAWVELNGRDLGLYVLTEGWDREFLKRHFKKTGGNLYDGGFLKEVTDELVANSGKDPKNQSDRIALAEAAKEPDLAKRRARLEKVLDLDRFLTFMALDVMLWDWDGYAMNRNNWRLYHDTDKDRMVFMPHGMDQMFWKTDGSILPPIQGLVAKAALEIPEVRTRYFERMKELRSSIFLPQAMTNRAHEIARKFSPELKEKYPDTARDQHAALTNFCESILLRGRSLDGQLSHPLEPMAFDPTGFAPLTQWESKSDFGFPLLQKPGAGSRVLEISTERGSSIGSWRTKVWLEKGKYQFQARVKTDGIVADPGDPFGGAGLRLASNRPAQYVLGNSDWKTLDYDFSVRDGLAEIQLVCEFRGSEGKALFDLDSLRLKRIDSKP